MKRSTKLNAKEEKLKQEMLAIQDFLQTYAPGTCAIPMKVSENSKQQLPDFIVPELGLAVEIKEAADESERKRSSAWLATCTNLTKKLNAALLAAGIKSKYFVDSQHPVIPTNLHNKVIDRILDAIRKGNVHISVVLKNNRYDMRNHLTVIKYKGPANLSLFDSSLSSYGAFGASSFVQHLFFREADDQGVRGDSSIDSANKQLANNPGGFKPSKKILLVTVGSSEYILPLLPSEIRAAFAEYQTILVQSTNIDEIWIRTEHNAEIQVYHVWSRVTL